MKFMEILDSQGGSQGASQGRSSSARSFDLARSGVAPPLYYGHYYQIVAVCLFVINRIIFTGRHFHFIVFIFSLFACVCFILPPLSCNFD